MKQKSARKFAIGLLIAIVIVVIIAIVASTSANAETNPYQPYYYQYSHTGTVICTQLTVRTEPSTSAREYGVLKNGQSCTILGKYGDWYIIDLSSCNYKNYPSGYGFAKESLIEQDPFWIVLTKYTDMYANPWRISNKKNGEQSGRVMLVIEENYPFYNVQCRESTAGSSFIYTWDVGQFSSPGQNLHVIVEDNVPILDPDNGIVFKKLSKYTIVNVKSVSGEYSLVALDYDTITEYLGWVKTQYVQRIAN